jgi:putative sterol carrier protein
MVKFLSEEWIEYGKQYIRSNLDPMKDLGSLTTSVLGVIEHVPPQDTSMTFYLELQNGQLSDFILRTGASIPEKTPVFIITGTYGAYKDIFEGKVGTAMAILKNRIKLKGSKVEALKIIKQLDGLIDALRKVTDEYEEMPRTS